MITESALKKEELPLVFSDSELISVDILRNFNLGSLKLYNQEPFRLVDG